MSKYLLKITGSDEIINIVKWNGVGELTAPEGHYYTPFVTESIDFIEYVPTSSIDEINYFGGSLFGTFEGELTGSININGRTLDTILYETRYGSITFLSGSNATAVSASKGITVSGSQLILALDNLEDGKQYNYSSSLATIVQNPTKNYVLKLKNVSNNNDQLEYVISNATIETDGESNYLNAIIKYTHNTFFDEFHTLAEGSTFYVDFDLGDEAYSGKFYGDLNGESGSLETLSVTGDLNISGSFNIGGEKFEEIFKIAPKPCTKLKYEESVINQLPTDGGLNPQGGYFIFDIDTSINGDYAENSWRIQKPTKIRLNLQTLGDELQQYEYETKLFDIIKYRSGDSEIFLEQILGNNVIQNAFKKFKIVRGIYRERSRRKESDGIYYTKYYYMDWGNRNFTETDQFFGQEDIDYFYGLDFNKIGDNSARDGFFEFDVIEIGPLNDPTIKPEQDAEFSVCITPKHVFREATIFTESGEYSVPTWCNKLTMLAIGAGGGGGGGAWGYPKDWYGVLTDSNISEPGGFDLAVGGGGGAGGNVAKSSFNLEAFGRNGIIPGVSKLNVLVGAPGKGGVGLEHDFPYKEINARCGFFIYYAPKYNNVSFAEASYFVSGPYDEENFDVALLSAYTGILIPKYFGKKGGSSMVYTKSGNHLVVAEGGTGGNPGVGYKSTTSFSNTYHNGYCIANHVYDRLHASKGTPTTVALGGASSTESSFGTDYVTPGGSGGYGFTTIPFVRKAKVEAGDDTTQINYVSPMLFNMNNAPNIPNDKKYNQDLRFYEPTNYEGRTSNDMSNTITSVIDLLVRKTPKSFALNLAPPGGGGGFGVRSLELTESPLGTRSAIEVTFFHKYADRDLQETQFDYQRIFGFHSNYWDNINFIIKEEPKIYINGVRDSEFGPEIKRFKLGFKNTNPTINTTDIENSLKKNIDGFIKINNCSSANDKQLELVFVSNLRTRAVPPRAKYNVSYQKLFNEPIGYPKPNDIRDNGRMYLYPPFDNDWDIEPNPGEIVFQLSPTNGSLSGTPPSNPEPNSAVTRKTLITKIHILDADGINREQEILGSINNIDGAFRILAGFTFFGTNTSIFYEGSDGNFYPDPNDRTKDVDTTKYVFRKINDYYIFELDYFGKYSDGKIFVFPNLNTTDEILSGLKPIAAINLETYSNARTFVASLSLNNTVDVEFISTYTETDDVLRTVPIPKNTKTIVVSQTKTTGEITGIYNVIQPPIEEDIVYGSNTYRHLKFPVEEIITSNNTSITSTYENISNTIEDSILKVACSDVSFYNEITSDKSSKFLIIAPFDGVQRFLTANKYANLGLGGRVKTPSNVLLYDIGTDNNGNPINLTIGNGGNGGFGQYFSSGRGVELKPELSNTLPEDVSDRWGVGGGGGGAMFLKEYADKNRIGDPDVPTKGQDGADGGPGIVVIIAEAVKE